MMNKLHPSKVSMSLSGVKCGHGVQLRIYYAYQQTSIPESTCSCACAWEEGSTPVTVCWWREQSHDQPVWRSCSLQTEVWGSRGQIYSIHQTQAAGVTGDFAGREWEMGLRDTAQHGRAQICAPPSPNVHGYHLWPRTQHMCTSVNTLPCTHP